MRLGLAGFSQSGKTTLFGALTGVVEATAKPGQAHVAMLPVPDARLARLRDINKSKVIIPAQIEIEDLPAIAPPGKPPAPDQAQTFAALRECDALIEVIRAFPSDTVPYHRDVLAPQRDQADLDAEFLLADLDIAQRRLEHVRHDLTKPMPDKKALEAELPVLERCVAALEEGRPLRAEDIKSSEERILRAYHFLSLKPHLVVFNVGEGGARQADPALAAVPRSIQIAAALERDLAALDPAERPTFMAEYGMTELVGPRLVRLAYQALNAITFFTGAEKETHAWTITRGETALAAAGEIHSDLARGFIRAEVIPYDKLDAAGSYREAKARGDMRLEGKDYAVRDGDVLLIRFST
jgi:GTP-binding protein YchF